MKKTFTTNSLPKIILLSNKPDEVEITYNNNGCDWYASQFDIIKCSDGVEAIEIYREYRFDVSAIVTQNAKYKDYLELETGLPRYAKRIWFNYDDHNNHGTEIYNCLQISQMNGYWRPKYSFVVPIYKTNRKYLKELYESVNNQYNNDWELVLLDDSPEPHLQAQSLAYQDCRVQYHRLNKQSKGNIGQTKWMANCLSHGKWLFELDHDDTLPWYCTMYLDKAIEEFPECGFFYSDTLSVDGEGKEIVAMYGQDFGMGFAHPYEWVDPSGNVLHPDDCADINPATIRHIVGVPNHLRCWKREAYFSIGGHNELLRIADDYELLVRTWLNVKMCHLRAPLYFQRFDGGNSQDADGGVNRADIQRRVDLIAYYYNDKIHQKMEEEYEGDPFYIKGDANTAAHSYTEENWPYICNEVYVPELNKRNDVN